MARNVLWLDSTIDQTQTVIEQAVAELGPTDFNVIMLPFLHVHQDQSLWYNNKPVSQLWSGVPAALQRLKGDFQTKKTLIASIGGWGNKLDFEYAAAKPSLFWDNLSKFCADFHIDGIDLDFEGPYDDKHLACLVIMAKTIKSQKASMLLTAAPYEDMDWWLGDGGLLSKTARPDGGNLFDWLNVQFYSGESNIGPSEWSATFKDWLDKLTGSWNGIGTANGPAFLVPGCNANSGYKTSALSQGIANGLKNYPAMGGAFVWTYTQIRGNAAPWASTIKNAFGGKAP